MSMLSNACRKDELEFDVNVDVIDTSANQLSKVLPSDDIETTFLDISAEQRVRWAIRHLSGRPVLSSSFGAQSAVMLHLLTTFEPDIPVILIDTGYLFPETYQFIDQLYDRLHLNLKVFRSDISPAWQQARYGKLWEKGANGLNHYNRINKVEPMRRALKTLQAGTWFSGLRRNQSSSRANTPFIEQRPAKEGLQSIWKVHPLADWTDRDIGMYLKQHDLPYHPLWDQGYVSIGDTHTTTRLADGMSAEETRFFGMQRECGIHTEI